MSKKGRLQQLFTKKQGNTNSATPSLLPTRESPSPELYRSITSLPLCKFIDVIVDKNLSALIISGYPSKEELESAWADIQTQYADAIGDQEHRLYLTLYKEVHILAITLEQIESLIRFLEQLAPYDIPHEQLEPLWKALNSLLFTSFKFNPDNKDEYLKLLKGCYNRSRSIKIDMDLKLANFKSIEEKQGEGQGYTRELFQSILITISDFAKYEIWDTITVFVFCERLRRYNQYRAQIEKQQRNGR
jgi:hypothetical protein